MRQTISFWLNDERVDLANVKADQTVLDFLRLHRQLTGTKEGCAEGDCGACTILVGHLVKGQLSYKSVNACICFLPALDGAHIVTIEHLKGKDGALHPVQQAMVTHHGSQCGFCTPGIIMSLYAMWMEHPQPDIALVERYLQGNLCRCTGYQPIIKAALAISENTKLEQDFLIAERQTIAENLKALDDDKPVQIGDETPDIFVPANLDQLAKIYHDNPNATLVAGATDVGLWVNKSMRDIRPAIFTARMADFKQWEKRDGALHIYGGVSYTELLPVIDKYIPQLSKFWRRIGGEQVRNMGTIGGNIANGSPIGDTPPPFIVLGASLLLRHGDKRREIPLKDFFIEYGKQDRQKGEFVEKIILPLPKDQSLFAAYKISKRRDEDISAVCGAFHFTIENGHISSARIAFGGMAGTPKRAENVEKALQDAPWSKHTILATKPLFEKDFAPLSDWRASASYRMAVAQNLTERFYNEHSAEQTTSLEDLHLNANEGALL